MPATAQLLTTAGLSFQELLAIIEQATHKLGFFPTKNPAHNGETRAEFREKIHIFLKGQLHYKEDARCTEASLDTQIYYGVKRQPVDRSFTVENQRVNELTLVWLCVFLRYRYRTTTDLAIALPKLKAIAIWLIGRYGYKISPESELLRMAALHWDEHALLWRIVEGNNGGIEAAIK